MKAVIKTNLKVPRENQAAYNPSNFIEEWYVLKRI